MWTSNLVLTRILWCILGAGISLGAKTDRQESCEVVNNRCVARVGCGMAWKNFMLLCNDLLYGVTTECTAHCTRALISLLSADEKSGVGYTGCDCGTDAACHLRKKRVDVCSQPVLGVIRALDDSTPVECNMAVWLCEADASCQRALMYYMSHCEFLLKGTNCTERCNSSLAVLYRHTKGAKLINCACEGEEKCTAMRVNTDRLCFHKNVSYKLHNTSSGARRSVHDLSTLLLMVVYSLNVYNMY